MRKQAALLIFMAWGGSAAADIPVDPSYTFVSLLFGQDRVSATKMIDGQVALSAGQTLEGKSEISPREFMAEIENCRLTELRDYAYGGSISMPPLADFSAKWSCGKYYKTAAVRYAGEGKVRIADFSSKLTPPPVYMPPKSGNQ